MKKRNGFVRRDIILNSTYNVGQYRTNEAVQMRMNFVQDTTAKIEGLLDVNRDFCRQQIAQNSPQISLLNCAVLPYAFSNRKSLKSN